MGGGGQLGCCGQPWVLDEEGSGPLWAMDKGRGQGW